jgi:hypothetical protein
MKNICKVKLASQITLAVIAIFVAVSCAPPVEISDYDWNAANDSIDPALNSSYTLSDFTPSASITDTTNGTGTALNTIIEIDVNITFPQSADVLRSEINGAALGFITFHTFTKATTEFTVDTLSAPIPFTIETRAGETVSVKLATSINTAAAYSNLVFKVDGKKYTYNHGLRLDIDGNGKIEAVYDDEYTEELDLSGTIDNYVGPGNTATFNLYFSSLPTIATYATAPSTPPTFFFTGNGTTTNSNTLNAVYIGEITGSTTTAQKDAYKDIGDTLAKGIKLQKLNGTTWTDAGSAEYEAPATTGYSYIVIKSVTFDHLASYRLIWTGSANTETAGTYYGVKVRLYLGGGARPLNKTEVVGAAITPYNSSLAKFFDPYNDDMGDVSVYSFDSYNKNVVLKVDLEDSGYYFDNVALADFKKSFQVVYSLSGGTPSNASSDLVYIDVKGIEFKAEGSAIVGGTEKGKNVLYITLDPNFLYDSNAYNDTYIWWLSNTYEPWNIAFQAYVRYQAYLAYQQYQSDYDDYYAEYSTWQDNYAAYQTYSDWEARRDAWVAEDTVNNDPDDYATSQNDLEPAAATDPGPQPQAPAYVPWAPSAPSATDPGSEPVFPGASTNKTPLYFRINDGISISDTASPKDVKVFGSAANFAYDYFAFYGPVF